MKIYVESIVPNLAVCHTLRHPFFWSLIFIYILLFYIILYETNKPSIFYEYEPCDVASSVRESTRLKRLKRLRGS